MASNILGSLFLLIKTKGDTSGLNKTDKAVKKTTRSLQTMSRHVGLLSGLSGKIFGAFNLANISNWTRSYVQFEKDIGAIKSRFYAITHDEAKAMEEFNYIRGVAKSTAMDILKTADAYSIFYTSARRALGKEGAREIFDTWSKIGRVLHLSEDKFERVMYAMREMSSKGRLYSQDLLIQMGTHVPDIRAIATEAIAGLGINGVNSIEGFQKYTKENPTGDAMAKFLLAFTKVAGERFASPDAVDKAMHQTDALLQSIMNYLKEFMIDFSQNSGAKILNEILTAIYDKLKEVDWKVVSGVIGGIAEALGSLITFLIDKIQVIIFILQSILIGKIANSMSRFFKNLGVLFGIAKGKKSVFLSRQFLQKGLEKTFFAGVTRALLKQGVKAGFGRIIGAIAGVFGGPAGIVISTLIWFLPDIFKLIKKIANKGKEDLFTTVGASPQEVYDTFKNVSLNREMMDNPFALKRALSNTDLGSKLSKYVYVDNGNMKIEFNGTILTKDDLENMIKAGGDELYNKRKNAPAMFNKPATQAQEITNQLRGY